MVKISVVIPTYNSLEYLPDALNSVVNQTYVDWELIIVNDGSSDKTDEWVSQQSDPRIILICQENKGKSAARNVGIERAASEYIAFLDADDYWETTKLEKQIKYIENNPEIGLVYTWTNLADQQCQPTGRIISSDAHGHVWKELVQYNILACGSTPLVRRICFETVGKFDPDLPLAQDWDMWIRIAAKYPFGVIKEPLVRYRQHRNNTSKNLEFMQQCNTLVLERAFASASTDVSDIRGRAYQSLNLYLGWIAIGIDDPKQAFYFWRLAFLSAPNLSGSTESIRLLIASFMTRLLGQERYNKIKEFNRRFRQSKIAQ